MNTQRHQQTQGNGTTSMQPAAGAPATSILEDIVDESERKWRRLQEQSAIGLRSRLFSQEISDYDKATAIVMIGDELGIAPMTAMREIHLIPGAGGPKPAISSHLKHAMARKKDPSFGLVVVQSDHRAAIVEAWRGNHERKRFAWSVADSEKAGLTAPTRNGHPSNHVKFPSQMFLARAISMAVDALVPEATVGFKTIEEVRDEQHLADVGASAPLATPDTMQAHPPSSAKSAQVLLDEVRDLRTKEDFEAWHVSTMPDRSELPADARRSVVDAWTKGFVAVGGQLRGAAVAKAAAAQAAVGPVTTLAQPDQAEGGEEKPAPTKAARRTLEQDRAEAAEAEKEISGQIDLIRSKADFDVWRELVTESWERMSSAGKQRMRAKAGALEKRLDEDAANEPLEPGSNG